MADPPGIHMQPSSAEEQQQQQQQQHQQQQQRRLQDELRRMETQMFHQAAAQGGGGNPPAVLSNLFMNNYAAAANLNNSNSSSNPNMGSNNSNNNNAVSASSLLSHGDFASIAAAGLFPLSEHGLLQILQQQQHQAQQQQDNGARASSGNRGNERPAEQQPSTDARAPAPNGSFPHNHSSAAPNALEAALSSLLFNSGQQQQQQQQQQQTLDHFRLLRTLQQLGVRLPVAQDPYAAAAVTAPHHHQHQLSLASDPNLLFRLAGLTVPAAQASADLRLNHVRDSGSMAMAVSSSSNQVFGNHAPSQADCQDTAPTTTAHAPPLPTTAAQKKKDKKSKKTKQQEQQGNEEEEYYPIPDLPKVRPLPPLEEGDTRHFAERVVVPLATDEDCNWLSERQCFIRAELLEVVRASHQDVLVRSSSKSVAYQQVGIRCRYCAHMHPSSRAIRSSAFPSSIRQMYQSFTMMVRDHWVGCSALPAPLKKRFMAYQEHKIPSSSLSREYWAYAAHKIGMINTEYGITITEESLAKAETLPSFGGTVADHANALQQRTTNGIKTLVHPSDEPAISPFLFLLMNQVEECYLLESERVGKRKEAPVGLTGFGCQHCIKQGRLGFCRVFPLNKRSLPTKVNDLYNHLQRCPLTPPETRNMLRQLKQLTSKMGGKFEERDREFVDQIWSKLGRRGAQIGSG